MDTDDEVVDEPDWGLRNELATSFEVSSFEKLLAEIGLDDGALRYVLIRIKEMEAISGDADPTVADGVGEVLGSLLAIFADYRRNPGRACLSALRAMEPPVRLRAISDTQEWLSELKTATEAELP